MSLAFKAVFLAVLFGGSGAYCQGRLEGSGGAKRFISPRYEFSMGVPDGWGVSTELETPVYFYAPPSARFVQAAIPEGGAVITVGSHEAVSGLGKTAATPREWALAEARTREPGGLPVEPFQMPKESMVSSAAMSSYDEATFSPDERRQHSVAIFWEFNHKLFAAHLNYNAGDPGGPNFEKVFLDTVRSIRPHAGAGNH